MSGCEITFPDMYPEFAPEPLRCGQRAVTRIHWHNPWGFESVDVCAGHANVIREDGGTWNVA